MPGANASARLGRPTPTCSRSAKATRPVVRTPPAEWIEVGHVPAIVTPDQFAAVQTQFVANQQRARRNNTNHNYLLRTLVSCGLCHLSCVGQTRRRYQYYTCGGRNSIVIRCRTERCPARLMPMAQLDAVVWADVCAVLTDPRPLDARTGTGTTR